MLKLTCVLMLSASLSHAETAETSIPKGLIRLGTGPYFSSYALVVDKKARTLSLWKNENQKLAKVNEFPSDMGKNAGDKSAEGDHRTPEGIYFLQKLMEGPGLPYDLYGIRAFTMDYPNVFDKRVGKGGSGIWLHAIPDKVSLERGSRGCVVVRNETIMELSKYIVPEKTPILIYESVAYVSEAERQKSMNEVEAWLGQWLRAWKTKDLDRYMTFYSEKFSGNGMNYDQWKKHKTGLNQTYAQIDVELFSPVIYGHADGWVIKSLQSYRSDKHEDFGEKTLYVQQEGDRLKIIEENWTPVIRNESVQNLAKCCSVTDVSANN
jgi:murein L,D-transpeptidase YafK